MGRDPAQGKFRVWVVFADSSDTASGFHGSRFNDLAAWVTRGPMCHCGLLWKPNDVLRMGTHASVLWGGKVFMRQEVFEVEGSDVVLGELGHMITREVSLPDKATPSMLATTVSEWVGRSYDYAGALSSATPLGLGSSDKKMFCSELVARALMALDVPPPAPPHRCTPNDIYRFLTPTEQT